MLTEYDRRLRRNGKKSPSTSETGFVFSARATHGSPLTVAIATIYYDRLTASSRQADMTTIESPSTVPTPGSSAPLWENPLGTDGFEFVEYTAPNTAQLGRLFESMGFSRVARHRSKDVSLYRQG